MRLRGFVNEDANTDFMETASCIGIICGPDLSNRLKKFVDGKGGDVESLLDEVKKFAGGGGYDWNKGGVASIKSLSINEPKKVNVCFNLIIGMNIFMQDVGYGIVGTSPHFIHGNIKAYYATEKKVFGDIPNTKDNTADCIVTNSDYKSLLKNIVPGTAPDEGLKYIITPKGQRYIQVSLKKDEAQAQLGKVTKMVKGLYDVEDTSAISKMFTNEGVWSKIKEFGGKIKSMISGLLGKVMKMFGKVNTKHLSDFERLMGVNESTRLSEKSATESTTALVNAVLTNPSRATGIVNNQLKKTLAMAESRGIPTKVSFNNNFSIKKQEDVFKMVGNYLTLKTIEDIISDEAKMRSSINRIVTEMYFGGTKLPLWKVFGYFGTKSWHYMGTLEAYMSNRQMPEVDVFGFRVNDAGYAYTITLFMIEDVNEKGKTYVELRTGTNSSSSVTFIVEGTKKLGPFPMDKTLSSII